MEILQIVPKLPPSISGVGDYALLIAKQLRATYGLESRLVIAGAHRNDDSLDGFAIEILGRHANALKSIVGRSDRVCLHYVGYGYQKRGCPIWLLRELTKWKSTNRATLVTVFHELFATGPIWSSSFWLSPVQKLIATKIARLSDAVVTNRQEYANMLSRMSPSGLAPVVLPVLSNVGEPATVKQYAERKPWLVLFGGDQWAEDALVLHANTIRAVCDQLELDRIVQIGSNLDFGFKTPRVEIMGVLPAAAISQILSQSKVGILNYYSGYLGKSGIFAAYCAHGVVPIFPVPNHSQADGLFHGQHYLLPNDLRTTGLESRLSLVAENVRRWYLGHNLKQTATTVAELLKI